MTPECLAAAHPLLYHLTDTQAVDGILRHGLLPTADLLALFDVPHARRATLTGTRRPEAVPLEHAVHGSARITDNTPLSESALAACLDGGLSPGDWLRMLNARVFFWPDEASLGRLAGARLNRGRDRTVLVLDTLGLARAQADCMELAPINTGATIRRPARRGPDTFTPLGRCSLAEWRRLRGGRDSVREVTVRGVVRDLDRHLVTTRRVTG